MSSRHLLVLLALGVLGCDGRTDPDAGGTDGGVTDAGSTDASSTDAARVQISAQVARNQEVFEKNLQDAIRLQRTAPSQKRWTVLKSEPILK